MDFLAFYKKQSIVTCPGEYSYLYDCLPLDVSTIRSVVQEIILHFWDGSIYNYQIPLKKLLGIETRYVSQMLKKIVELDSSPLTIERSLDKKIVGSCRDYSTLLCSILRYFGIPARTRVGFCTYVLKEYHHDIVILEYWNYEKNKWCLVDPRINLAYIHRLNLNIEFDLLDVPRDKLVTAGLAWQMVRNQKACANDFCGGNVNTNKGMWYIRDRLVQDFAALNSVEMQLWDTWGIMHQSQMIEYDEKQLNYIDKIAQLTLDNDTKLDEIMIQFEQDENLKVPRKILSYSPVYKRREVYLPSITRTPCFGDIIP